MRIYEQDDVENFPQSPNNKNVVPDAFQNPAPDNPPWNWATALLVWLISYLLLAILPSIVIIPYALNKGISFQDGEALKTFLLNDPTALLLQIGSVIPVHLVTFALSWAVVTNFNKFSFRETLGWQWGGFKIWHIVAIIIFFFLLGAGLTGIFGEQENDFTRILKSSRTAVYFIAFMATFTAPVVEEVVYRGIVYSAFRKRFGIWAGVIVVTAIFAGVHFYQYWGDFTSLIMVSLLSLTLTFIRARTSNLLPCIILHTVFNGIQSLLLLLEPFLTR